MCQTFILINVQIGLTFNPGSVGKRMTWFILDTMIKSFPASDEVLIVLFFVSETKS